MNKELKQFLYMLVGKEFTRENYEKTLMYFNQIVQQKEHYKKKTLDNLFMKNFNGEKIICLENDKETFKDMIFMLQERIDRSLEFISNNSYLINYSIDSKNFLERLIVILTGEDYE